MEGGSDKLKNMIQSFTVYFDTSFYIQLCNADPSLADHIINELNDMQVRHVISDVIILELLSSGDRSNKDGLLVERVKRFQISPYSTNTELAWEVLLLAGTERIALADFLKSIDDMAAEAKSSSIMARRKVSPEREENLLNASKPLLEAFGFPDDLATDLPQTIAAARVMLENLGMRDVTWPTDLTPENLLSLSEQIKGKLGDSVVEQLEKQDRLYDSVTATDDRPYQVAAKEASSKIRKKLANTLRDSEHMMRFVQNLNEIQILQVDSAQEQIIKRGKPLHYLAEQGLAERCFSASSLSEAVKIVCNLKDLFRQ